jgi:hypothetical protein
MGDNKTRMRTSGEQAAAMAAVPTTSQASTTMTIHSIRVGSMVHVASRTWPGINKPGGAARVLKLHYNTSNNAVATTANNNSSAIVNAIVAVDVHYMVEGRREKRVLMEFVTHAPELEDNVDMDMEEDFDPAPPWAKATAATTSDAPQQQQQHLSQAPASMGGTKENAGIGGEAVSTAPRLPPPSALTRRRVEGRRRVLRDRAALLGRCTRCGSLRLDCGSCDFAYDNDNSHSGVLPLQDANSNDKKQNQSNDNAQKNKITEEQQKRQEQQRNNRSKKKKLSKKKRNKKKITADSFIQAQGSGASSLRTKGRLLMSPVREELLDEGSTTNIHSSGSSSESDGDNQHENYEHRDSDNDSSSDDNNSFLAKIQAARRRQRQEDSGASGEQARAVRRQTSFIDSDADDSGSSSDVEDYEEYLSTLRRQQAASKRQRRRLNKFLETALQMSSSQPVATQQDVAGAGIGLNIAEQAASVLETIADSNSNAPRTTSSRPSQHQSLQRSAGTPIAAVTVATAAAERGAPATVQNHSNKDDRVNRNSEKKNNKAKTSGIIGTSSVNISSDNRSTKANESEHYDDNDNNNDDNNNMAQQEHYDVDQEESQLFDQDLTQQHQPHHPRMDNSSSVDVSSQEIVEGLPLPSFGLTAATTNTGTNINHPSRSYDEGDHMNDNDDDDTDSISMANGASGDDDNDEADHVVRMDVNDDPVQEQQPEPVYLCPQDADGFIQPEGRNVSETLPLDTVDQSAGVPFLELATFFETVANSLEEKLFRARQELVRLQSAASGRTITIQLQQQQQSQNLYVTLCLSLIRDGVDQCQACLRRLESRKEAASFLSQLSSNKERRRFHLRNESFGFRHTGLNNQVETLMKEVRAFVKEVSASVKKSSEEATLDQNIFDTHSTSESSDNENEGSSGSEQVGRGGGCANNGNKNEEKDSNLPFYYTSDSGDDCGEDNGNRGQQTYYSSAEDEDYRGLGLDDDDSAVASHNAARNNMNHRPPSSLNDNNNRNVPDRPFDPHEHATTRKRPRSTNANNDNNDRHSRSRGSGSGRPRQKQKKHHSRSRDDTSVQRPKANGARHGGLLLQSSQSKRVKSTSNKSSHHGKRNRSRSDSTAGGRFHQLFGLQGHGQTSHGRSSRGTSSSERGNKAKNSSHHEHPSASSSGDGTRGSRQHDNLQHQDRSNHNDDQQNVLPWQDGDSDNDNADADDPDGSQYQIMSASQRQRSASHQEGSSSFGTGSANVNGIAGAINGGASAPGTNATGQLSIQNFARPTQSNAHRPTMTDLFQRIQENKNNDADASHQAIMGQSSSVAAMNAAGSVGATSDDHYAHSFAVLLEHGKTSLVSLWKSSSHPNANDNGIAIANRSTVEFFKTACSILKEVPSFVELLHCGGPHLYRCLELCTVMFEFLKERGRDSLLEAAAAMHNKNTPEGRILASPQVLAEVVHLQVVDLIYSQYLVDAWGGAPRLSRDAWSMLHNLISVVASSFPVVELLSNIMIKQFKCQEWRQLSASSSHLKGFVSSCNSKEIRQYFQTGEKKMGPGESASIS